MKHELFKLLCLMAGAFIAITALLAMVGYFVDAVYLVTWGGATQMALPTATLFFTIGVLFVMFGTSISRKD